MIRKKFDIGELEAKELASRLEMENTVSACSFCNSTTSRDQNERTMDQVLLSSETEEEMIGAVRSEAAKVLTRKRRNVKWKLESVRERFNTVVRAQLAQKRDREEVE